MCAEHTRHGGPLQATPSLARPTSARASTQPPWHPRYLRPFHLLCSFRQYAGLVSRELTPKYNAAEHWAKIEVGGRAAAAGRGSSEKGLELASC